jgi:hypothetical protein
MAIGKPEAKMTATLNFRLCGQVWAAPSGVVDQSILRIRRAISPGGLPETTVLIGQAEGSSLV